MLDTENADALLALFDNFNVPMFAAERDVAGDPFRLVCINKALADASGLDPDKVRSVPLSDALPPEEAEAVQLRYAQCADRREHCRYFESLTLPMGVLHWDTCLQYVPLRNGHDRVVGTTLPVIRNRDADHSRLVFDDIRFFSHLADMQLQNLVSMFEVARRSDLFCSDSLGRVDTLIGVCRSVQQAVTDIRDTVRKADQVSAHDKVGQTCNGDETLRALLESVQDQDVRGAG